MSLTPDDLTELERRLAAVTPGPYDILDRGHPLMGYDLEPFEGGLRGAFERQEDAAYLCALLNAAPELLRVYRGAQGDRSLAARMHRETRIQTLELELQRLRGTVRAYLAVPDPRLSLHGRTLDEFSDALELYAARRGDLEGEVDGA